MRRRSTSETAEGVMIGTVAFMSPEQARGRPVDKRADIWAFGCVLYQMLTRKRAFPGATSSDTIVEILDREPDWNALPADTPPAVRRLLKRCLQKDVKLRLRDIGDARARAAGGDRRPGRNGVESSHVAGIPSRASLGDRRRAGRGRGAAALEHAIERRRDDAAAADARPHDPR